MRFDDQTSLGFVEAQTEKIETQVFEKKYPEITYARDIPVDTSGNKWISAVSFYSQDTIGQAALINGKSDDVPMATLTREKHTVGISMAGIGYEFSDEEVGQAQMMGMDLSADGAMAARRAYERFIDDLAYTGHPDVADGKGLYNLDGVTSTAAASAWGDAGTTAESILDDVNGLLTRIYEATKGMERANVLHLPQASIALLASARLSDHTDTTILEYLRRTNILTATTGEPLDIRGDHRLADKAVAYRKDPDVLRLHLPMPLEFKAPQAKGLGYVVHGRFRVSGLEVRTPAAIQELTGL